MSHLRSKIFAALVVFAALTASPYVARAQTWSPPTCPPPGCNTEAPVNIGDNSQTKKGFLTIGKGSTLKGQTIFTNQTNPGPNFFASFVPSNFYNDVNLGGQFVPLAPANVNIFGNLNYKTVSDGGTPENPNAGDVLTADANGNAIWQAPTGGNGGGTLPPASIDGQFYAWNASTNSWQLTTHFLATEDGDPPAFKIMDGSYLQIFGTGVVQDSGDFVVRPNGLVNFMPSATGNLKFMGAGNTAVNKILADADGNGTVAWKTAAELGLGGSSSTLPDGVNQGEVLYWSTASNPDKWLVSPDVKVDPTWPAPGDKFRVTGATHTVAVNNNGSLLAPSIGGSDLALDSSLYLEGADLKINLANSPSPAVGQVLTLDNVDGTAKWADASGGGGGGLPSATVGQTLWYDGTNWLPTSSLLYNTVGDNLKFNGADFYLGGGNQDPAVGRFLYSTSNNGKSTWNKNLVADVIPDFLGSGLNLDVIKVKADSPDLVAFENEGPTWLMGQATIDGRTTINDDLVVSNAGNLYLFNSQTSSNPDELVHLCINIYSHKVEQCPTPTTGGGNPFNPTSATFGPEDNGDTYTFDFSGEVDIKFCGGGGGGGGGGIGYVNFQDDGVGGSGGGGGEAGKCQTLNDVDVEPGDVLSWNIGTGGEGGKGAYYRADSLYGITGPNPSEGGAGGSTDPTQQTRVYLNGNQLGSTQNGGNGGLPGQSVFQTNPTPDDPVPIPAIGLGGSVTSSVNSNAWWHNGHKGQLQEYSPCSSCGGIGGVGETATGSSVIATAGNPGYRGEGGVLGGPNAGGPGFNGVRSIGGGGGGGGAGHANGSFVMEGFTPHITYTYKGGNGGTGGDGYINLSGIPAIPAPQPTEIVFTSDGTLSPSDIPANITQITVEVWGGGGGGGGAKTTSAGQEAFAGGGGAGAYARLENFPRPTTDVSIVVGQGGSAGSSSAPTNGGNGGQSSFGTAVTAAGGMGGGLDQSNVGYGTGGNGATATTGATQHTDGADGQDGGPGASNGAPANNGEGAGGDGAMDSSGQNLIQALAGFNGKVRISW